MGFEWVDHFEDETTTTIPEARIQHLYDLTDEEIVEEAKEDMDPWTDTALRIQSDLQRMAHWIQSKQHEYVGLNMPDSEATIIQSTVTTFAATTASELETMRQLISSGGTAAGHRNGIVQILLSQLQEDITQPFGVLQKQRTRVAVKLWQHPWQCQLALPKDQSRKMQHLEGDHNDDEDAHWAAKDKRFLPRTGNPARTIDFWDLYEKDPLDDMPPLQKPVFLERLVDTRKASNHSFSLTATPLAPILQVTPATPSLPYQERQRLEQDELQQEAVLLQETIVQSDLDSVQKMEQRMVEITTLIGQFANLVSEQQEDILDIAHHAHETKQNMTKGQENLVDATERTKRSKHYLAWTIVGLSLTLLFFHTLRN